MTEVVDKSSTEEILKCPICLEFYVDPTHLPCLHTFCKSCLQSFLTSSIKEEIAKPKAKVEFACPVCRTIVTGSYPKGGSMEELASQFPKHQTISSLLDKHNIKTNVKYCDSCLNEKSENPAKTWCKVCCEAFCEECTKYHRKTTVLKSHKLVQLNDVAKDDFDVTRLEFCFVHKDEVLKAFCKDHDKACCVTCVTIDHRKCDDVTTLDVAAEGIKEATETQELLKRLRDSENALLEMLRIRKQNVNRLETQKETMLAELTAFRNSIDKHLNDLEGKLKSDISSTEKKFILEENDYIADLENKYTTVMNYRKLLEACLQKASDVNILLEIKRLINKTQHLSEELSACAGDVQEINLELQFQPEIKKTLSILNLGRVNERKTWPHFIHVKSVGKSRVREISTFQLPNEIRSGTFLKNGNVVLTMSSNFVFCDQNGGKMITTNVPGASSLNGVTVFNDDAILLARSSASKVYNVNTYSRELNIWKSDFCCDNIINTGDQIIAACETNIVVLNFNGDITKQIQVRGNKTSYIAHHDGIVYYTISTEHAVRAVSLNGEHGFEYKNPDLKDPRGIDTDTFGKIYVAGYGSSNVHRISKDGQLLNIILTDIVNPRVICVSKTGDRLLVTDIVNPRVICVSKTGDRLLVTHSRSKVNVYEFY